MPLGAKLAISTAAACLLVFLAMLAFLPLDEEQVRQLFDSAATALTERDADGIIEVFDADYDFIKHWPRLENWDDIEDPEDMASVRKAIRTLAGRFLALQVVQGVTTTFTYEVQDLTETGPDTMEASVAISLHGGNVPAHISTSKPRTIRFTLRRHGWLRPAMRILAHEPLSD